MRALSIFVLALGAAALPAQFRVSPANFGIAEGNTYESEPFGITTSPFRTIQVHDDLAGHAGSIKGLRLRRDGSLTTSYASFQVFCDVLLSTAATSAKAMSTTFDSNHGPDKTKVLNFTQVIFPATTHALPAAPFVYNVPFATPFTYGGASGLCWEAVIQVRQNTFTAYFNACSGASTNPYPVVLNYGSGCKVDKFTSGMYLNGSSSMNWSTKSATFDYNGGRATKNSVVLLLIGVSNQSYGGVPLPFELPGTAQATSGKCHLYVAPILALPSFTDASGNFSLKLGAGLIPDMNGANLFGQALATDPAANPLGLGTSNLVLHHILAPWTTVPVGRVYASNLGATGTVQNNRGMIVRFDY